MTAVDYLERHLSHDTGKGTRVQSLRETVDLTAYFREAREIERKREQEAFEQGKALGYICPERK